ncbi:MAG: glycosyltransferase [Planctomycetes bacterium]|nr:glycosyltransferase [Planctomycetota bacterium]
MRLLMTALGSYGDVLPIVGLASAMNARGHQATIIANPLFQPIIEAAGAGFVPIGTEEQYDEFTHHPDSWHPIRGPILAFRNFVSVHLHKLYELIDENHRPGETVLVAHCLDMASRVHQDKHGTPVASVHLAPLTLRSLHESPQMFGMWLHSWLPRWFKRAQYWVADQICDHLLAPELDTLRRGLGLEPVRGVMREWYFSPQLVLGLFPDWFARPQPDWPPNTVLTGFPLWDQSATMELSEEVDKFLSAGDPPVVFTPGSAMTNGRWFFEAAVDACRRLNRRGILVTNYPEQLPRELPSTVRHFGFVPFSRLLPRAAALVHHGGIGTSGQGLAAGLPQLVMPMAYDQLDNATRLKRLGVAATIRRNKFRSPAVAQALDSLLTLESVRAAGRHWAEQCDSAQALVASCEALEKLAETSLAVRRQPSARLAPRG